MEAMRNGDAAAMAFDRDGQGLEGDPRQFVLRGDPRLDRVMASLEGLGVDRFTIVLRFRYPDDADVFPTFPAFKKGGRFSAARIKAVRLAQRELGDLIGEAVQTAIRGTAADGCELLVEAVVVVARDGGVTAHTTVIAPDPDGDFCDRPIELM